ncbi:MAG TPA: ADP-glyceromanno-heptose 6-epimerase [Pirellulales bacterium]
MFIVTGGAGFIGSVMLWKLNTLGIDDVLVVDLPSSPASARCLDRLVYRDYLSADRFLDLVERRGLPKRVQGVFHMGACSSTLETSAAYLHRVNYGYTRTLAQWALNENIRFVYASSAATYGDGALGYSDEEAQSLDLKPLNLYGWSKQWFDDWAIRAGAAARMVGVKFFNVFGPHENHKGVMASLVYKAYHEIVKTGSLKLFMSHRPDYEHGEQKRDFVYVKDCVDVLWRLYQRRDVNGLLNLGTGTARTWNDLARSIFAAMGRPFNVEYVPMPETLRGQYQYFTQADVSKLQRLGLAGEFRSLEESVRDYVVNHLAATEPRLSAARTPCAGRASLISDALGDLAATEFSSGSAQVSPV